MWQRCGSFQIVALSPAPLFIEFDNVAIFKRWCKFEKLIRCGNAGIDNPIKFGKIGNAGY